MISVHDLNRRLREPHGARIWAICALDRLQVQEQVRRAMIWSINEDFVYFRITHFMHHVLARPLRDLFETREEAREDLRRRRAVRALTDRP